MKNKEIIGDQDAVVLKRLSNPVKTTSIDRNTRVSDDDDVSHLNDEVSSEKRGLPERSERPRKVTVIGNHGPDANGKVDWDKNPDCVDSILQYHESFGHSDDTDGYLKTGERCFRQFNKMFASGQTPANVTAEEIADGLAKHYSPSRVSEVKAQTLGNSSRPSSAAPAKVETFYKVRAKNLPVVSDSKVRLRGTQFEICKILNCKNICVMQPSQGAPEHNGIFHAACANSDGTTINPVGCPQLEELPEKEQLAFEMFKQQFNGDELQAKKFLFLTRKIYSK